MFSGVIFTPDRFVGGDDPATTIRSLVLRENAISGANIRLLTWLAAFIKLGGNDLRLDKEALDALPQRFGIHHRYDATGVVVLSVVPITDEMCVEMMGEPDAKERSEPAVPEKTDDASN